MRDPSKVEEEGVEVGKFCQREGRKGGEASENVSEEGEGTEEAI